MRFTDITIAEAKVGREYQHLEDLVFVDGAKGAVQAVSILNRLGKDTSDVALKWDGSPTVYWGREANGQFVLVGKNGWGRNMSTSSKDLYNFIMSTGKGEDWRKEFGTVMATVFDIMERNTPADLRGYLYGDLLWGPGKTQKADKGDITFTPNHVKYMVRMDTDLGAKITNAALGIAIHTSYKEFGGKDGTPVEDVQRYSTDEVLLFGQTYVTHTPDVDTSDTQKIVQFAKKHAKEIDKFLEPVAGLADMKNIIYTYVNQTSRAKNLANIETEFSNWLKTSKVSAGKQAKIEALEQAMPNASPAIFMLIRMIMTVKDNIIAQLDQAEDTIKSSTDGEDGGEGYVAGRDKVKLVPRQRWTPN